MYIAEVTEPPTFGTPGLPDFTNYPTAGSALTDVRDVLNWEASGHNTSNWNTYFYARVADDNLSAATLHYDIVSDINYGKPVVAEVMTNDLPNWPTGSHNQIHYITIVGYDDGSGTYAYTDTCSQGCGSLYNGGVNYISQSTGSQNLLKAITDYGPSNQYNGGFDW